MTKCGGSWLGGLPRSVPRKRRIELWMFAIGVVTGLLMGLAVAFR